jgi:hypothetical protein
LAFHIEFYDREKLRLLVHLAQHCCRDATTAGQ